MNGDPVMRVRVVLELYISLDKKTVKELEEIAFQFNEAGNIDENDVLEYLKNMINNGKITLWELNIKALKGDR